MLYWRFQLHLKYSIRFYWFPSSDHASHCQGIILLLLRIFLFFNQSKYPHLYSWTIISNLKTTNSYHPLSTWINYLDLLLHSPIWMNAIEGKLNMLYVLLARENLNSIIFLSKANKINAVKRQHWPMQVQRPSWADRQGNVVALK